MEIKTRETTPYSAIEPQTVIRYKGAGSSKGIDRLRMDSYVKDVPEVERDMLRDTDRLIGMLDGSIVSESKGFAHGERQFDGSVDGAIYLDKSARPVRALVHELWSGMSSKGAKSEEPPAAFLNIDKEEYLYYLGYTPSDFREKYIDPDGLALDMLDSDELKPRLAGIRALFLADRTKLRWAEDLIQDVRDGMRDADALDAVWNEKSLLDDQHIALVDEVKSSGATLIIAEKLLSLAFPSTQLEPMYWSTPHVHMADSVNTAGEQVKMIGDTEKPLWYDSNRSDGRGNVENKDPELSAQSSSVAQRLGAYVLSVPYSAVNDGKQDALGLAFRTDFKTMAQRFRDREIKNYVPSADRELDDSIQRLENYYQMPHEQWLSARRR